MSSENRKLHVVLFPLMAYGHMIPLFDMAKLFASRGLKSTLVTTPINAPFCSKHIEKAKNLGLDVNIKILKFPGVEVGLPGGYETVDITPEDGDIAIKFLMATNMMQQPFEQFLEEGKADCVVADVFFPWATDSAAKFGIPRLLFNCYGAFSSCMEESIRVHAPHKKVLSDCEPFVWPDLPGEIKLTKKQLPETSVGDLDEFFVKLIEQWRESELKCLGVVFNSFYELEPAYADHYKNVNGRRTWSIGPLSLCSRHIEDKAKRVNNAETDGHECFKWLDSKKPNSVVYVSFGSVTSFNDAQLKEIALGLEASGQDFLWVVKKSKTNKIKNEDWLPKGFEKRMEGKGLIVRGWVPQEQILHHVAIGGFVTHCGWNSTLEGICAGLPMVTWPVLVDQGFTHKLVIRVLKTGIDVEEWRGMKDFVKRESIEKAVREIMVGDRAEEIRSKAKAFSEMAKKAIDKGGSSYSDLSALIEEIRCYRH